MKLSNNGGERGDKHKVKNTQPPIPTRVKGCLYMCSRKSDRYVLVWTRISALSTLEIFRGAESPPLRAGVSALGMWNKSSAQNFRLSSVRHLWLCQHG